MTITPYWLPHGDIEALGFASAVSPMRPISTAYRGERTDVRGPRHAADRRAALRPHPSHFSLDEALETIARFRPKRAVLTNMHTDIDYETLAHSLPPNVVPAFDGMRLKA